MLRWKSRFMPVLVVIAIAAAAAVDAAGGFFNLGW